MNRPAAQAEPQAGGIRITRYGNRHWAVWMENELIVVTLYKKGATSVAARLRLLAELLTTHESRDHVHVSQTAHKQTPANRASQ